MDKMSQNCKKSELIKTAREYIIMGMSKEETKELLQLDGYDQDMVKSFMESENFSEEISNNTLPHWGFDIEDNHGRIYSSADFNIIITAKSKQEAFEKAEEEIEKFSTLQLDQVVGVYKI